MDYFAHFQAALTYDDYLGKYANPQQLQRWQESRDAVQLSAEQLALLQSFTREMNVLVMAGAWCGDCVSQCPIFDHFSTANSLIHVRFADRDDGSGLKDTLTICGAARVPSVVFLSEDGYLCGRYGDRTLSEYRRVVSRMQGAACATGIVTGTDLRSAVIQDWLDEFERIQWMLRTSSRLRNLHGD